MSDAVNSASWGLFPVLFGISSYTVFVVLALAVATAYYLMCATKAQVGLERAAIVLIGALLGAGIGARLPFFTKMVVGGAFAATATLDGKTMLTGLAGGLIGAFFAKRIFRISHPLGNIAAPAMALGFGIGRIGCAGVGCCFGKAATWGIHLGDGLTRYPTQLFEVAFHCCAFVVLHRLRKNGCAQGMLLAGYLAAYLCFRYVTEFLREGHAVFAGQTSYQLICICGIAALAGWMFFSLARQKREVTHFE